ncbi:MAG TPA: alpha/beta fold hydrolase, partial [Candidatus Dormibacteraeota bacterium]|nr:alpha/beta fold hydrolase [Candidatus Dormibacteraeota bacterium]
NPSTARRKVQFFSPLQRSNSSILDQRYLATALGTRLRIRYTPKLVMAEAFHRTFFLNGPAGRLEAMLWTVSNTDPCRVAVVCHPHPLFGGTMHNKVVFQIAKTLHQLEIPVLRFNFRGAGLSEGKHDKGRSEAGDVRAALDYLAREFAAKPILLAGFSFGSYVGLRVGCEDSRVKELVGLGIPVDNSDLSFLAECGKPKLILQSAHDQFGSREHVEALYEKLPEPKTLVFVDAQDHFFAGKLPEMGHALGQWVTKQNQ